MRGLLSVAEHDVISFSEACLHRAISDKALIPRRILVFRWLFFGATSLPWKIRQLDIPINHAPGLRR
jgi:hypothetical protein